MIAKKFTYMVRSYAVERYQGMATQTVQEVRQVAITRREPTA